MEASVSNTPTKPEARASIWSNRKFRSLFAAYSISTFGDWFDMIAVSILLGYVWRVDPMLVALLPLVYAMPSILFGQMAGVIADRSKKWRLMIGSDLISAAITAGLIFAPNVWWVFPLLFLRSLSSVFNAPAQQALTRQVVAEDHLLKATAMNGLVNQLAKIAGPLLGAAVLIAISPKMCLAINAVSFFFSACLLLKLGSLPEDRPADRHIEAGAPGPTFRQSWKEGWQALLQKRVLLSTIVFSFFGLMAVVLVDFQLPVLFRDIYPDHEELFGWSVAASGLGSVCSIALLNRRKDLRSYGWMFGGGYFLIGLGMAVKGALVPGASMLWPLVTGFASGVGNGMWIITGAYLFQKEPPEDKVGRVIGIRDSLSSVVLVVGPLVGGWLVKTHGASATFSGAGMWVCGIGLAGILFQKWIWKK
jgi:MFS family permease